MSVLLYLKAYAPLSYMVVAGGVIVATLAAWLAVALWLDARRHAKFVKGLKAKP